MSFHSILCYRFYSATELFSKHNLEAHRLDIPHGSQKLTVGRITAIAAFVLIYIIEISARSCPEESARRKGCTEYFIYLNTRSGEVYISFVFIFLPLFLFMPKNCSGAQKAASIKAHIRISYLA